MTWTMILWVMVGSAQSMVTVDSLPTYAACREAIDVSVQIARDGGGMIPVAICEPSIQPVGWRI